MKSFRKARRRPRQRACSAADLVVGYNIVGFDYEVLMAYTILDLPHHLPTLDLLLEVEKSIGHRLKLEDVAQGTLGVGKSGRGALTPFAGGAKES